MIHFPRESGILLHISSLPGSYGIGELGSEAIRFVSCLKAMNQRLWQILPLGHTGQHFSPYDLLSSFAGNPLLISINSLVKEGYLREKDLISLSRSNTQTVKFKYLCNIKMKLLDRAAEYFLDNISEKEKLLYNKFCEDNDYWLDSYSIFWNIRVLSNYKHWTNWKDSFKFREKISIDQFRKKNKREIKKTKCIQYFFQKQWNYLKEYANKNGIRIIGDLPLYVSHDSAEVWTNPELFTLNKNGGLRYVSGVPPCFFSETGQLWGHPLYRWDVHKNTRFNWWKSRFKRLYELVDIVRIDHFNGFKKYWKIPAENSTAMNGEWAEGPGENFFEEIINCLGNNAIIAEDLGEAQQEAEGLKDKYGIPGMKILQTAFGNGEKSYPHNFPENCVAYTGTHDNDTTIGWFHSQPKKGSRQTKNEIEFERKKVLKYLKTDGKDIHWEMIKTLISSKANTVIIPLQDILGLDSASRMNVPGTVSGNWQWRFDWNMLTQEKMRRMQKITTKFNRNHI